MRSTSDNASNDMFQLSIFPHQTQGKTRPARSSGNSLDSVSALDLWHETLMTVASNEHERDHEAQLDPGIISSNLDRTMDLWDLMAREEKKTHPRSKGGAPMTKRQRKKITRTLLRGFAPDSASRTSFKVSNLFSYERRFSTVGAKMTSDEESVEIDDLQRLHQT